MKLQASQTIKSDVLVIGGGGAGLRAAIEARKHGCDVLLVSESPIGLRNNTAISKATITATGIGKEPSDSPELLLKDTLVGGRFTNDSEMVKVMGRGAKQQVYDLINFGVDFKKKDRELFVWQLPGHAYPRHVSGETFRGIDLTRPLRDYAAKVGVRFVEGIVITKLLQAGDIVVGTLGINEKGEVFVFSAKSTILATGGAGEVYLRTSNAVGSTGDGYALAYDAGATLRDMEFVQFYPTTFGKKGSRICLYEKYMRKGAVLRNSMGEDILKRYGIGDDLSATRDKLAIIIAGEIAEGRGIEGNLAFDFTGASGVADDLHHDGLAGKGESTERLLVAPSAHFFMGGVKINEKSETGINGLYAAGEVCGGMHGANRIGGNALAEAFVFGTIAGESAAVRASNMKLVAASQKEMKFGMEMLTKFTSGSGHGDIEELKQSLKRTMWEKVGVIRDEKNLKEAEKEIAAISKQLKSMYISAPEILPHAVKLNNMLLVSEMIRRAALMRTESRGAHYRTDYPEEDNKKWLKIIEICCRKGEMALNAVPVGGGKQVIN